jgi:hypothetical protein
MLVGDYAQKQLVRARNGQTGSQTLISIFPEWSLADAGRNLQVHLLGSRARTVSDRRVGQLCADFVAEVGKFDREPRP